MNAKLSRALVEKKIVSPDLLASLEKEAMLSSVPIEELLVSKGVIEEKSLAFLKGQLYGLPYVDLDEIDISHDALVSLPQSVAENYRIVVYEKNGSAVRIAMVNPDDFRAIEAIDFWANKNGFTREFAITTDAAYRNAMKGYTVFTEEVGEAIQSLQQNKVQEKKIEKKERLGEVIRKAPVAKIVQLMIQEAVDMNASDIHIEPGREESRMRFRVDGILRTYLTVPMSFHQSIVARIKVLSDLKIDETRIPQDGRIRINVYGADINLRVSTLPLVGNEKVVMRILPTTTKSITLSDLGFWGKALDDMNKIIERPTGVLLVSGPTGSGKSTTLSSMLASLNKENVNITTLEDPVEYYIAGVNQVQINPDVGLTFVSGLRAILRQDPNIVMVGEIRDFETAELATHAALTGHFMLSTIHAKDVLGVIPRLTDMHVEPFLIAAALNMISAQRLVRKLCDSCKETMAPPPIVMREVEQMLKAIPDRSAVSDIDFSKDPVFYKSVGCDECGGKGYKGRTVIVELLQMTESLSEILGRKFTIEDLQQEQVRQKQLSMKQDAIIKALRGVTTLEEYLRVTRE